MYDILIKNGLIVDGSGKPAFYGDLAVKDGKIAKIAPSIQESADEVMDASGLQVAPGFIDNHSHSDSSVFTGSDSYNYLEQGVTTQVAGQCGSSPAPYSETELADAKVDAVYLGPDAFMNANRKTLIDAAAAFSIPVFSASEGAVRHDGALFALVHRYYNVGRLAGRKALKILRDKVQAYDIPIETPQRPLAVVNMTAARKTGVYPPLDLLQSADLVNIPESE